MKTIAIWKIKLECKINNKSFWNNPRKNAKQFLILALKPWKCIFAIGWKVKKHHILCRCSIFIILYFIKNYSVLCKFRDSGRKMSANIFHGSNLYAIFLKQKYFILWFIICRLSDMKLGFKQWSTFFIQILKDMAFSFHPKLPTVFLLLTY